MTQPSMQQVKELRDRTQAGLNDCKSALTESGGDMEKAVEIILKKGLAKSAKRAVIVEVNIQTDFAARNAEFLAFADSVAKAALAAKPGSDLGKEVFPGG